MTQILSDKVVEALESDAELSPELTRMMKNARAASDFLKALAHESRLLLLCLLSERERSVTELEELLSLRQTTVSQQLARLRLDGLVTTRREGKTVYYRLADANTLKFVKVIYEMFCSGPDAETRRS
ncbi:MAG TPA: metalloregulator ArsR/SmtB family transcription factor [Hyphomicrobiaceae bacterium]|nr:metalloregulator ArsR/SmtB family transcription factor [Hyphomicrobiaceae bacterium]